MQFVTYNNIRLKCYINVSKCLLDILYIAPHEVAGSSILARAIDNFKLFFDKLKSLKRIFSIEIYKTPDQALQNQFQYSLHSWLSCQDC